MKLWFLKGIFSSKYSRYILGVVGVIGAVFLAIQYIQYQERQRIQIQHQIEELKDHMDTRERIDEGVRRIGPDEHTAREWLLRRQENRQ